MWHWFLGVLPPLIYVHIYTHKNIFIYLFSRSVPVSLTILLCFCNIHLYLYTRICIYFKSTEFLWILHYTWPQLKVQYLWFFLCFCNICTYMYIHEYTHISKAQIFIYLFSRSVPVSLTLLLCFCNIHLYLYTRICIYFKSTEFLWILHYTWPQLKVQYLWFFLCFCNICTYIMMMIAFIITLGEIM